MLQRFVPIEVLQMLPIQGTTRVLSLHVGGSLAVGGTPERLVQKGFIGIQRWKALILSCLGVLV